MYLQDANLERIDAELFKMDILKSFDDEPLVSESEIETELAEMYQQAADTTAPFIYESSVSFIAERKSNFSVAFAGRSIWRRLLAYLCRILNATSTAGDILNAILDYLLSIIPGGILLKGIIRKILKYFLDKGYNALCPV